MYGVHPPNGSGSVSDAAAETSELRTYQAWKGSNIFFLQGRFIFGPDVRSLFLTIVLVVAPVAIFCVFVARKLMDDFSHHLGISIMPIVIVFTLYERPVLQWLLVGGVLAALLCDLVLLLLTSGRDPGIVPRNAHPPEPESFGGSTEVGPGQTPQLCLPRTRDVVVNGIIVKIKYCDTCMLYRPLRCSHCSICNNCVERFDHHCPWVGQCIGSRNYRFFFMFVFSTTLLCLYVFGFCWVYIKRIMDSEETSIWKAMTTTPASIVLIIYTFISVWFVGGLSIFHLYLIGINQSTYENFRSRYDQRANPYNKGIVQNFMEIFCTSIPPSKNKFRAKVKKEPGIPPRVVSSSFMSPNLEKAVADIEMGRKTVGNEAAGGTGEFEGRIRNDDVLDKSNKYAELSPELSRTAPAEGSGGQNTLHPRRSSWGRRSGSWDISPEAVAATSGVGNSNQINVGSSGSISVENGQ